MKIKFNVAPKARDYKVGDVVEFNGPIPEGYARKYINRGWAEEYVEPKPEPAKAKPPEPKETLSLKSKDGLSGKDGLVGEAGVQK